MDLEPDLRDAWAKGNRIPMFTHVSRLYVRVRVRARVREYSSVERVPYAQGRAIDRLLEYGANTKIHACEKRYAGHGLVKQNCELLMAKIKQRQAQG